MKITTVGRQITVPEDLKAQVAAKLKKFDKFFPEEGTATVTYSRKHGKECLEVTINAAGTLFRARRGPSIDLFQHWTSINMPI